jgi:hypothetical protein
VKQLKNLAVAFAFVGLLATSGIANADPKLYVEVGAMWANPGDASAEFPKIQAPAGTLAKWQAVNCKSGLTLVQSVPKENFAFFRALSMPLVVA